MPLWQQVEDRRVLHFWHDILCTGTEFLPDAAKLLIGVSSVTDPTGKTLYYEYDELGRLKRNYYYENNIMQESEKRVLQEYDYHYRNQ